MASRVGKFVEQGFEIAPLGAEGLAGRHLYAVRGRQIVRIGFPSLVDDGALLHPGYDGLCVLGHRRSCGRLGYRGRGKRDAVNLARIKDRVEL